MKTLTVISVKSFDNGITVAFGTKTEVKSALGLASKSEEVCRVALKETHLKAGDTIDLDTVPHTINTKTYANKTTGEEFQVNWMVLK